MGQGRSSAEGAARDERVSSTTPFTDVHAIVFADFGLSMREPLSARQHELLREAIEPSLLVAGFVAGEKSEGAGDSPTIYRRTTSDTDEVVEEFHIHANHIHLFMNEYRGWQVTKKIAMERLDPVWALARDPQFELAESRLSLGYRDAFSNHDPGTNSSHDVFKPNSLLPQYVFGAGLFWRHQLTLMEIGSKEDPWEQIFSRLAIEAHIRDLAEQAQEDVDADEQLVHWTDITHRQQLAGNSEADPEVEWSIETIEERLDLLHRRNKEVMIELLSCEMAERIGLTEGKR